MQLRFIRHSGSEFDVVIMVVPPTSPMLLTRNLLYTGITRAKKMLILISNEKTIDYMIQNVDSKKRITRIRIQNEAIGVSLYCLIFVEKRKKMR